MPFHRAQIFLPLLFNMDQRPLDVYKRQTYHALPETGGEKAFELLRRAMHEEQKDDA